MADDPYATTTQDGPAGGNTVEKRDTVIRHPVGRDERIVFVVKAALIVAAVGFGFFIAWQIYEVFLLVLLSIVFATVLLAAADPVRRYTHLSHRWSLTVVGVVLFLLIAGLVWLTGSQVAGQLGQLGEQLQQAVQSIEQSLGISLSGLGQDGQGQGGTFAGLASVLQDFVGRLTSLGRTILAVLAGLILAVIGAFFLAAAPDKYIEGVVKLFPKSQQPRIDDALRASGNVLRLWLLAQLISMAIVGVLVWLGTWLIGLPASLGLGIFAAVTEFIPYLGPWIGAAPAVILALSEGGTTLLWTILLFVGIQQIESNLVTPLVQQEMVEIPAALLLFAVLAVGLLFGVVGMIVAGPLTVVVYVLVKKLYVRQTLHVPTHVPGEEREAEHR